MTKMEQIAARRGVILAAIVRAFEAGEPFPQIAALNAAGGYAGVQPTYNDLSALVADGMLLPDPAGRMAAVGEGAFRPSRSWTPTDAGIRRVAGTSAEEVAS